jgi:hypothetical protein
MADGGVMIELDAALGARLREAAEAAGQSADEYAAALIAQGLDDGWNETRESLAHYDRTGEYVEAGQALTAFRAALTQRLDQAR